MTPEDAAKLQQQYAAQMAYPQVPQQQQQYAPAVQQQPAAQQPIQKQSVQH